VGETANAQNVFPSIDPDSVLTLLLPAFRIEETPEPSETISTEAATFQIYEMSAQGLAVFLALGEVEGDTIMVLMTALPGEADALYESLFLPAVQAAERIE
jgi:hypothetical protein